MTNYIPSFSEFTASLNETMDSYSVNNAEELSIIDDIIDVAKQMKASDPVMWRGMSTKSGTYGRSKTFVHLVTDRGDFRGGNDGAIKMMQYLKIKEPIFVKYDSESVKFFGPVYAAIPKKPWAVYQSALVDDVKGFNTETPYYTKDGISRSSIEIQKYRIEDTETLDRVTNSLEKLGYERIKSTLVELENDIHNMDDTEKEMRKVFFTSPTNELIVAIPPNWQEIEQIYKESIPPGKKYGGVKLDDVETGKVYVRNTGKRMEARAKKGAASYKKLSGTTPDDWKAEAILDCNDYWAVKMDDVISNGGKFMKFKSPKDIKTYKDIIDALYAFQSFKKWQFSK